MYRVVIVDDEPVIRAGLREILPWEELGMRIVFEAEHGASAYAYLCDNQADILITDIRMEGMDGLELIEKAKARNPRLHCVILTGFDDFAYTKQAIRLGIENYILKPVDENELMETLVSIEHKLDQEQRGDSVLDKEKQVILQMVLERWLTGSIEETALRHRAAFLGIPVDGSYVQTCVLRVLDTQRAAQRQNLGLALIRAWKPLEDVWMGVCWETRRDLVLVFSGEVVKRAFNLRSQVQDFVRAAAWNGQAQLFAAFGTARQDVLGLECSYRDARMVAELSLVLPAGSVVEYTEQYARSIGDTIPQVDFERLELVIREGDDQGVCRIWDGWEREVSRLRVDPKLLKSYAAEAMCRLIVLETDTFQTEDRDWDKQSVLEALFEAGTVGQLARELQEVSLSFSRRLRQANASLNPSVRRCIEAVEKHYDQELTLRGLAEQFHVNPVYLGRLFKEETGQAFTAYLNQVRLREAKRLLLESDKSVAAVAAAVGYLSQGYFTNLFKKSVGCFPREYRLKPR